MTYLGDRDWLIEVAKGNVAGHSLVHKYGKNPSVAAGTEEDILQVAANFNWLQAATPVRIKAGGSVNDVAGGSGALAIVVYGIDDSGMLANETIATAGASATVATSTSFWRVFRAVVSEVGAYGGDNDGNIVIENSAGGTDLIQITAGEGQSQFGAYSIPTGKTGYFMGLEAQVDTGNNEATLSIYTRDDFNDVSAPMKARRLRNEFPGISGLFSFRPKSPSMSLPGYSDIWIAATAGSGTAAVVSVDFEILLVDN